MAGPRPRPRPRRRTAAAAVGACGLALLLAAASATPTPTPPPPDDPLVSRQHHLPAVRAFEAWEVRRGEGAVVAVLDTGVDLEHPDLAGRLVEGIDLVEPDTPPDDPEGHGTIVAGIVAAVAGNGRGVAGTAPQAQVMPIRVLDEEGRGTSDVVAEGIRHAVEQQVEVINLSLAEVTAEEGVIELDLVADRQVQEAIAEAAEAGVLVVAAAGNDGDTATPYAYDAPVLVVGALTPEGEVWPESNRDDRTLFAPGVDILSTWYDGRYAQADGTSFATPVVAAGAAMLIGAGLDAETARQRLVDTAAPLGEGLGRVDLAAAVEGLPEAPPPPPPPPAPPPTTPPAGSPEPAPSSTGGGLAEVVQVEEVTEVTPPPPATVTAAPPPIATPAPPVATVAPTTPPGTGLEVPEPVAEDAVQPAGTPTAAPPLAVQDGGVGLDRAALIPLATALLGADVLLAGVVWHRRRRS